jgi:glycosyltransferase involved in cell wall biosynthesis
MMPPRSHCALGSHTPALADESFPLLAEQCSLKINGRPLEVCIVSNGVLGPVRNGGISTLYMGLAETLVEAGHRVTYLYTGGSYTESEPVEEWVEHYREKQINLVALPEPEHRILNSHNIRISYATYQWLRRNDRFDVIHFHEWQGHAYYSLLAKHQGLAFGQSTLCVSTHSPTTWNKQGNHEYMNQVADLETDYMERKCVLLAELLISSSHYMFNWLLSQSWQLPSKCFVQPNVLPPSALSRLGIDPSDERTTERFEKIDELVFFGRLEGRKGLALFCGALDRLAAISSEEFKVTFLGKNGSIAGQSGLDYLEKRSRDWPFPWRAVTTLDNVEAMAYLKQPGRVAVMPSLMDNSPLALQECLLAGIPFLATLTGGIPEMIRAEDHAHVLCFPRPAALAERLRAVLRDGLSPATPAVQERRSRENWLSWHDSLPRRDEFTPIRECTETTQPLVSVCISHFNRPDYLDQALNSLRRQDYPHLEVLLVDDGSTKPVALAFLASLEEEFRSKNWKILRQENRYPGAARNNAARNARGEYLLFMDDDNLAKPDAISRFVKVAQTTGADVLTCFADVFRGHETPLPRQKPDYRWLYLGDSLAAGALYNCFGDTNALVRRDAFLELGGFTEDHGYNHEDKELFARAILRGYRLEVVPEALYWYRQNHEGINISSDSFLNHMRGLRPYRDILPPTLDHVFTFALAQFLHLNSLPRDHSAVSPVVGEAWPLRYRIADQINARIKRFSRLHRAARTIFAGLIALKRAGSSRGGAKRGSWPDSKSGRSGESIPALRGSHQAKRAHELKPVRDQVTASGDGV